MSAMKPQVLVLLYPGCIPQEIALAADLLSEKFAVVTATPDGKKLADTRGLPLHVDRDYSSVTLDGVAAVLVPGGDPGSVVENARLSEILREANAKKILVAAICAGPLLPAKAGILKGKRIAHGYGPKELAFLASYFVDVELTDLPFVADGNLLTAKPDAAIEFAVEIGCRLGVVDASKANRTKEYHRGLLGRQIRVLALAAIRDAKGRFLLHRAVDSVKGEAFYRALGGGVEFGETGRVAVAREIEEELGIHAEVGDLLGTFENIFVYEGRGGHEIVQVFTVRFPTPGHYAHESLDIVESGQVVGQAVWRSLEEVTREGAKLYPNGFAEAVKNVPAAS